MLITQRKNPEEILRGIDGPVFVLSCFGCAEVLFPEEEIAAALRDLKPRLTGSDRADYCCREAFARAFLDRRREEIAAARAVVVFSCGVGVQTVARLLADRPVLAGCDTMRINGFQGLKAAAADCRQCGECWLNATAGICPLTACAKGLLNGPCGGYRDGKCEVDPEKDCAWVLIYERLKAQGRLDLLKTYHEPKNQAPRSTPRKYEWPRPAAQEGKS